MRQHRPYSILLVAVVALLFARVLDATAQGAQQATPPATTRDPAATAEPPGGTDLQAIEGKIKRVDVTARKLILDNGREFMIPETVRLDQSRLKPGLRVRLRYEEKEGTSVARMVEIQRP